MAEACRRSSVNLEGADVTRPPFAVPFLKAGRLLIGQTPNILLYLGGRLGLAPRDEAGKLWTHQLQLTIADFIVEAHDTHHPIGSGLYYHEQKREGEAADARLPGASPAEVLRLLRACAGAQSGPRALACRHPAYVRGSIAGASRRRAALRVAEGDSQRVAQSSAPARAARCCVRPAAHQALCGVVAKAGVQR